MTTEERGQVQKTRVRSCGDTFFEPGDLTRSLLTIRSRSTLRNCHHSRDINPQIQQQRALQISKKKLNLITSAAAQGNLGLATPKGKSKAEANDEVGSHDEKIDYDVSHAAGDMPAKLIVTKS